MNFVKTVSEPTSRPFRKTLTHHNVSMDYEMHGAGAESLFGYGVEVQEVSVEIETAGR